MSVVVVVVDDDDGMKCSTAHVFHLLNVAFCWRAVYKEMSDESLSTNSHLSVAMTTTEIGKVQTTGQNTMPLSSRGDIFYFQCAVVVIGVVGAAANALILYAMVASKQHKKQFLIFHQNVFDLCSCLLLVIIYALKLCNIYLTGTLGYWLCMLLVSENLLWCSLNGSMINLMSITIERYLKVVHHAWSKKFLRKWVKFLAAAFAWLGAIAHNMFTVFSTSAVVDGVCYVIWSSRVTAVAYGIWNFITFHLIVICIFVFCYGRILVVIRRQARVMAGHGGPGSSTTQTHSHQMQSNVIKTMIFVSAFYFATWMPCSLWYLILNVHPSFPYLASAHYLTTFIAFFYVSANPFIYATKFKPVKGVLARLIPCKTSQSGGESVDMR